MKLSAKDWQVIRDYADHYGLRPQLSVPSAGQYTFRDREGHESTVSMAAMRAAVTLWRTQDKRV